MRVPRFPLALLLPLCFAVLSGCGVSFHDPPEGNEFFKTLTVTGDMHAGSPLTGAVTFVQNYSVEVAVRCEVRKGKDLYKNVGQDPAPPLPNGNPMATPFPGNFAFDFTVDEPGAFKFECFTPSDEDNFILKQFTIGPARDPALTPIPATPGQ